MGKYDIVIGLEIHAELNTKSKIFCACANYASGLIPKEREDIANERVCPVCMGLPGALPVLNRAVVEKTILAGLCFGCKINEIAVYDRKNYFYPDLPKAYQISQMYHPICLGGGIKLRSGKFIRLNRIHSEEDAGKLLHDDVNEITLLDFNRCGSPLIEMVTEPDFATAAEAVEFLEEVRSRLIYAGIANCKMEEGGMRCDVNISLKPAGSTKLGNRVEMKNLNSWKMVARAIEYETKRQTNLLDDNKRIAMETRKWNDGKGTTTAMRTKETDVDYRYFPDPDQYPIHIGADTVATIKKSMPRLAVEYKAEFTEKFKLPEYDADILTRDKKLTDFYLECVRLYNTPVEISKWLLTYILARAQNYVLQITPKQLTDIMKLTNTKKISRNNAVVLIENIWGKNDDAGALAGKLKMTGGMSTAELQKTIDGIFAANPTAIADYKTTPDKVINFFMGQTMKATRGLADSTAAKEIILKKLK